MPYAALMPPLRPQMSKRDLHWFQKETYDASKRDLRCKQKRPAMHGNEACVHAHMRRRIHACHMRRRIHACQKRLTLVSKETYTVSNETYTSVKRDLRTLGGALVPPLTPCSLLA